MKLYYELDMCTPNPTFLGDYFIAIRLHYYTLIIHKERKQRRERERERERRRKYKTSLVSGKSGPKRHKLIRPFNVINFLCAGSET
jgi:hypothetical protein